ncbi:zinc finger protein 217-like [Leptodactylus fuscus]|uniref:zinc finger protein 217-like n=1 Tax=Leptodactylus fuscus TaxID=238119 RepID=UPI003F4F0E27
MSAATKDVSVDASICGLKQADPDGTFDCKFCAESYKHHEELEDHVQTQHRPGEPNLLSDKTEYLGPHDGRNVEGSVKEEHGVHEGSECEVCGQIFAHLESHMKTHTAPFIFPCNICDKIFTKPWYLKLHQRIHSIQVRRGANQETPTTINETVQEEATNHVLSPYRPCKVCGSLFPDKDSLLDHSKIHNKVTCEESAPREELENGPKEDFLNLVGLKPSKDNKPVASWIRELDPVTTSQAWQLATTGKLVSDGARGKDVKEPVYDASMEPDKGEPTDIEKTGRTSQSGDNCAGTSKSQGRGQPEKYHLEGETEVQIVQNKTPVRHDSVHRANSKSNKLPPASSPANVEETVKMEVQSEDVGRGKKSF